ncbi:putative glucosylceramidase 3 [Diabrotica virgifera virgifera]|uniref:Glucosylceramidase n=3 Tax=Diabrotica virgifera virgifera TaxID=50390 RepID=A0ABM5KHX0_DIAVI|nr:putative glucosylceramidase 3 [Diabrotica virgifera virgifera]
MFTVNSRSRYRMFRESIFLTLGVLLAGVVFSSSDTVKSQNPEECLARDYGKGSVVCVCNDQHCDYSPPVEPVPKNKYIVYTSNQAGLRFKKEVKTYTNAKSGKHCFVPPNDDICEHDWDTSYRVCGVLVPSHLIPSANIFVEPSILYQEVMGWGGAVTDSTVINVANMTKTLQEHLLRSYYSTDGLDYNFARVPMGGTDFSTRFYSYIDTLEHVVDCVDHSLKDFKLAPEDIDLKIPFLKRARQLRNDLKLFSSTWVLPTAYKENNSYMGFLGFIRKEVYQLLADYYIKFFDLYKERGLSFWGVSSTNEPFIAMAEFSIPGTPGNLWTPEDLGYWIRDHLGPTIKRSDHSHLKLITLDDQRSLLRVVPQIVRDAETSQYVDGFATHFYMDFKNNTYLLDNVNEQFPDKFIMVTEACVGALGIFLGDWSNAETYADDIIQNMNHHVTGWVDWNMVLDLQGGPNVAAARDAPILNNNGTEFLKQPLYYAIGHFSKFVPPGSYRIYSSQCNENDLVTQVAFERPDGGIVVVILNRSEQQIQRKIIDCKKNNINLDLSPRSITTVLYW